MKIEKEELKKLYTDELKSDKEIAIIFNINPLKIGKIRKEYGIATINAKLKDTIRKSKNPLSQRQKSILLGSLLGDACLKSRNDFSAYISFSHSIKQKKYTDWLYEEFKSVCVSPPKSHISKEIYTTYDFYSENRIDLKELKNNIYTPNKKVTKWWIDQLDDLSIAVWYMDDGTLSYVNKTKMSFSFATNSFSMEENYLLSDMLKEKFNICSEIKPITRKNKIQYNLVISDCSFSDFENLIAKHVVDELKYKLTGNKNDESLIRNIEIKISKEELEDLYCNKKMTQEQIADKLEIHKVTISKYMDIYGIEVRNQTESQLNGKNNNNRNLNGTFGTIENRELNSNEEEIAVNLFNNMRKNGFPYVEKRSDEHYIGMLDVISGINVCDLKDNIFSYSRTGMEICSSLCPQIFSMASNGSKTPIEIFNSDDMLMDCVRRTIKYAKKNSIAAVRQGLKTYKKNRCVTIFPPMWAKTIIRNSLNKDNLSVLDFSCGFGGRLIGSYASGIVSKYVGIDPVEANIISHKEIYKKIKVHSEMRNKHFETEFIHGCAEDKINNIQEKFDIIMTSPPYFSKEVYGMTEEQCYIKYPYYNEWKEKWLEQVLKISYDKLNNGGKMIIFASNYGKYPMGIDCREIMKSISNNDVSLFLFSIPSLEYYRSKDIKKYDSCWIAKKD